MTTYTEQFTTEPVGTGIKEVLCSTTRMVQLFVPWAARFNVFFRVDEGPWQQLTLGEWSEMLQVSQKIQLTATPENCACRFRWLIPDVVTQTGQLTAEELAILRQLVLNPPQSIKGDKGDKGDAGAAPTNAALQALITPLIPSPVKGDKGDKGDVGASPSNASLTALITPLIPSPVKGDKGDQGDSPSSATLTALITPLIPAPVKGDKGDKGDAGAAAVVVYGFPVARTLVAGTAYQASTPSKPAKVTVNLSAKSAITLTGSTNNQAQIVIGSTNAVASGTGSALGLYKNNLTGAVVVGINLNSEQANTYSFDLPANGWFAIRQTAGTGLVVESAFDQTVG